MWLKNKIAQYKNYKYGVKHCTFNPEGPGVVRIHLVPPKFKLFGSAPHIVILNGYYLLPIGYSWAILLSAFIDEVNKYDGLPIDNEAEYDIFYALVQDNTVVDAVDGHAVHLGDDELHIIHQHQRQKTQQKRGQVAQIVFVDVLSKEHRITSFRIIGRIIYFITT